MSMNTSDESPRRAKAKRNLFGRVDHDQIRNDLHRELTLIGEEKNKSGTLTLRIVSRLKADSNGSGLAEDFKRANHQ